MTLTPFFKKRAFKNIAWRQCEDWLINRGSENISLQLQASEARADRPLHFKYAISLWVVLDNVTADALLI